MKFKKPKFWEKNRSKFFPYLLLPISYILKILRFLSFCLPKKEKKFNIKTICVGNIYIGGTGKTSLSLRINEILKKKNIKSCFIKKDYPNQTDEQKILSNHGKLFLSKKRVAALKKAINENYEIAIFDDGLQDHSIKYDICFVCFNDTNWVGNGFTIPSGPLREDLNNLIKYKHVCINGNMENLDIIKHQINIINPNIKIHLGEYVPINLEEFDLSKNYLAFSGIGNHQSFIKMLKNYNIKVINDIEFPDHYKYSDEEIKKLISIAKKYSAKIVTTEKDLNRIDVQKFNEIKIIKSKLNVINEVDFLSAIFETNEQD